MKKKYCRYLAALLLALTLASCQKPEKTEKPAPPEEGTVIMKSGKSYYTIVRGADADGTVIAAAGKLHGAIRGKTGKSIGISDDWTKKNDSDAKNRHEILIGCTEREESKRFIANLAPMTYAVGKINNKILIAGTDSFLTYEAVEDFISRYVNDDCCGKGTFVIKDEIQSVKHVVPNPARYISEGAELKAVERKIFEVKDKDGFRNLQGGCSDGNYYYLGLQKEEEGKIAMTTIYVYELNTWKFVKKSKPLPLSHCNDMCYNPKTNEILVVHNRPDRNNISVLDPDTLKIKRRITLLFEIYSLSYNESKDLYVAGLSGGEDFALMKSDFKGMKKYCPAVTTGYITQGSACDDNYIYFVLFKENVITVYDWNGAFVNKTKLDFGGIEPEHIFPNGNSFIIGCGSPDGNGEDCYEVTLIPKK